MDKAAVNKQVRLFSLYDQHGTLIKSEDLSKHRYVVLYFYPKDNTAGWTSEASEFRDLIHEFANLSTVVIGVSRDSMQSHKRFSEKLQLPFSLLVDQEQELHQYFDVLKEKKMFGKTVMGTERSTFIMNQEGVLIKEYRGVKASGHAKTVLNDLKQSD